MTDELQLFEDQSGFNRVGIVDFGIPFVGTNHERTLWLRNMDKQWAIEDITFTFKDPNLTVEYPTTLQANETRTVRIFWRPSADRREPLDMTKFFVGRLIIGKR